MSIEYTLGKTNSGKYQQLRCGEETEAIIRNMSMLGFGDCISFRRKKNDGSTFGSDWGLGNLGCFSELQPYTRLMDMPQQDIDKLGVRMYELLFMDSEGDERYNLEPRIDGRQPKYQQILEELTTLQETERRLTDSGEIIFPNISQEELAWQDLW